MRKMPWNSAIISVTFQRGEDSSKTMLYAFTIHTGKDPIFIYNNQAPNIICTSHPSTAYGLNKEHIQKSVSQWASKYNDNSQDKNEA